MTTPASARRRNTNGCCVGSISAPTTGWVGGDLDAEALGDEALGGGRRQEAAFVVEHERRPRRRTVRRSRARAARRRRSPAPARGARPWTGARDPVARITASGASASTSSAVAATPLRSSAPARFGLVAQPVDVARPALPAPPRRRRGAPVRRARGGARRARRRGRAARRRARPPARRPRRRRRRPGPGSRPGASVGELRVADARVHRAPHRPVGVEAADAALVEADARPRGPAGARLRGQVGVGDDRARHRDEVDAARDARVGHRGLDVAPGHEDRDADGLAEAPRALVVDALRELVAGTKYAVDSRVAPVPPLTLNRSIAPVAARLRAISISSSGPSPPVRHWSTAIRNPTMKSSETAARTASSTSRPKRVRFSRLPPYSSVRVLTRGVEELLDQVAAERRHLAAVPAAALQARRRLGEPLHDRRDLGRVAAAPAPRGGRPPEGRTARAAGCPVIVDVPAPPHVRHLRHAAARRGGGRRRPARAAPARCARPRARSSRTTPRSSGRPTPSRTS